MRGKYNLLNCWNRELLAPNLPRSKHLEKKIWLPELLIRISLIENNIIDYAFEVFYFGDKH